MIFVVHRHNQIAVTQMRHDDRVDGKSEFSTREMPTMSGNDLVDGLALVETVR